MIKIKFALLFTLLMPTLAHALPQPFHGYGQAFELIHGSGATLSLDDDIALEFGTGTDYWWIYDSANTQLELNSTDCDGGGTDCVVLSVDDGDAILDLRNDEFIHNETDGKITLGGAGGTNNESLILDFESAANNITLTSGTGATVLSWAGSIYGSATSNLGLTGRSLVKAPAVGQIGLTNWASSSGATLDVDDAADTIVIKDQAGTGNGNLTVTGTTNTAAVEFNVTSIDSDDSAYTVLATDHVIVCDPDSGSVPADTTISLPASAGIGRTIIVKNIGTTYDCLVDPNGTEEIDNSGAGTAITVDTKGSLTVIDVGASTFEWIIE